MLAACYAANIATAYVGPTVGPSGNKSERYCSGTPAKCRMIDVCLWQNVGHTLVLGVFVMDCFVVLSF